MYWQFNVYMINLFYVCYLSYFDNSMINLKFLLDQTIHILILNIFHKCIML